MKDHQALQDAAFLHAVGVPPPPEDGGEGVDEGERKGESASAGMKTEVKEDAPKK